jgi:chromosome partitioning protein
MAYTIAISNEKGGVAKTTSTLSLGAALTELGQKVLLLDLDPQANLSLALGFEPGKVEHT